MPKFYYVARNRAGVKETGKVEAPSQDDAVAIIQSKSLTVVSFTRTAAPFVCLFTYIKISSRKTMPINTMFFSFILNCPTNAILYGTVGVFF